MNINKELKHENIMKYPISIREALKRQRLQEATREFALYISEAIKQQELEKEKQMSQSKTNKNKFKKIYYNNLL